MESPVAQQGAEGAGGARAPPCAKPSPAPAPAAAEPATPPTDVPRVVVGKDKVVVNDEHEVELVLPNELRWIVNRFDVCSQELTLGRCEHCAVDLLDAIS